jgi:hypothetical protein
MINKKRIFLEIEPFDQINTKLTSLNSLCSPAKRGKRPANSLDPVRYVPALALQRNKHPPSAWRDGWQNQLEIHTLLQKTDPKPNGLTYT